MATEHGEELDAAELAAGIKGDQPDRAPRWATTGRASAAGWSSSAGWVVSAPAWEAVARDARRFGAMLGRFEHLGQQAVRLHGGLAAARLVLPGRSNLAGIGKREHLVLPDFGRAWPTVRWQGVFTPPKSFESLATFAFRAGAALGRLVPANLDSLPIEDWGRLQQLSRDEGLALAWAPRPTLVAALLEAPDATAREQLLLDAEADVLEDCAACLDEVTHPDVVGLAAFVREAVAACRAGLHAPAQALATNVVDTVASHHLDRVATSTFAGKGVSQRIKAAFGEPLGDDDCLRAWRFGLVGAAVFAAYREGYDYRARGSAYNRHGTVHCVNPGVYRKVNALRAVLLATTLLRLMTEELTEEEQAA
jgi:hypothetical protein